MSTTVTIGTETWLLAVLREVRGEPASMHAYQPGVLGDLSGRVHIGLADVDTDGAWNRADVLGFMRAGMLAAHHATIRELIGDATDHVDRWYDAARPALQVVRGDGPEIISSRDGSIAGLIDWGGVRVGNFADDIGCWTLHGATDEWPLTAYTNEFLRAYSNHRRLSRDEESAVALFQDLRLASRASYVTEPAALDYVDGWAATAKSS